MKNSAVVDNNYFLAFFQTNVISLEALPKIIEPGQLTSDLEGTFHYDHSQWIDMRLVSLKV